MVKVKMFLCACLCILAVPAAPARGNSILIRNIYRLHWAQVQGEKMTWYGKATLSDLIVYGENNKEEVILKPGDPNDDIVFEPLGTKIFHVNFEITKFEISTLCRKDSEQPADWGVGYFEGKIIVPTDVPKKEKKIGFIRDPDGQQTVVLAIDGAVAPLEPPPEGTILAFVEGYNEIMPNWFVGTGIDFETGQVTGAYTGDVEVFSTAFEVTIFDFYPPNDAVDMPLDTDLSWPKSEEAVSYDVYFGTNYDDVKRGRGGTFKASQSGTTYDPGTLEPGTTYYWKIDGCFLEVEEVQVGEFIIIEEYEVCDEGPVWSFTTGPAKATNPHPSNGATDVDPNAILSWTPGCGAAFHDVYFGADFYAVANADTSDTTGIYRGRIAFDAYSYDPAGLELGTTYYWKIDEVVPTVGELWRVCEGDIWYFTTADLALFIVDDFESYVDHANLRTMWKDGSVNESCSTVELSTDPVHGGAQAMKFTYNNLSPPYYSQTEMEFDSPQDWTRYGVKTLSLSFCSEPNNSEEYVCVCISDGTNELIMSQCEENQDIGYFCVVGWQEWNIDLRGFSDAGVDLTNIKKIYIGVGDRDNPQPGGTGTVYFDDITLGTEPCPIADDPNECKVCLTRYIVDGPVTVTYVSSPYTFYESNEEPVEEISWDYSSSAENEVAVVYIYFKNGDVLQIECAPGADKCKMQFPQLMSGTPKFTFGELTVACTPK